MNNQISTNLNPDCKIIAIASGKGGVGKSTTAINIAYALAHQGLKIGLLDADIYGPSLPTLLNIHKKPGIATLNGSNKIVPFVFKGVVVMSIGFLVNEEEAIVWRGLMIQKALSQLLNDVLWNVEGPLDYLIVDLPPGTGDVQLTLIQKTHLTGAIIISTPQDLALIDAKRAVQMFQKTNTPVLGIIENMSTFKCPSCKEETPIFKTNTLKEYAKSLHIPFLGHIPLHQDLVITSDNGTPIVLNDQNSSISKTYAEISQTIKDMTNAL